MGRHEFGRPDGADRPDIAEVLADDALLDALGRRPRTIRGPHRDPRRDAEGPAPKVVRERLFDHPEDRRLLDLFVTWRSGIDRMATPEPPPPDRVAAAIGSAARRRTFRSMLGVAAAIAALLVGSATVGSRTAHPGDMLWPVTQAIWADRADSVVAGNTARQALGQARNALDAGLTNEARSQLDIVSTALPRVAERDGHRVIEADMDNLLSTLDWIQRQQTPPSSAVPEPAVVPAAPPLAGATTGAPIERPAGPGPSDPADRSTDPSRPASSSASPIAPSSGPSVPPSSAVSDPSRPSAPASSAPSPTAPAAPSPTTVAPSAPAGSTAPPTSSAVPSGAPASSATPTPASLAPTPAPSTNSAVPTTSAPAPTSETAQLVPVLPTDATPATTAALAPPASSADASSAQQQAVASVVSTAG